MKNIIEYLKIVLQAIKVLDVIVTEQEPTEYNKLYIYNVPLVKKPFYIIIVLQIYLIKKYQIVINLY